MGKIISLISQARNNTARWVGFEVSPNGNCPLPELPPGKTRHFKVSRILQCLRKRGRDWRIRVLVDGQFSGIEINPLILLKRTRILFRYGDGSDSHVFFVEGVREKKFIDLWLRLKYFGFMRNRYWDGRQTFLIERSDSRLAKKLRELEARDDQHVSSFLDTPLHKRVIADGSHSDTANPPTRGDGRGTRRRREAEPRKPPAPKKIGGPDIGAAKPPVRRETAGADISAAQSPARREIVGFDVGTAQPPVWRAIGGSDVGAAQSPVWREIVGSDIVGAQRSIQREEMITVSDPEPAHADSFEYLFLFCCALALAWFVAS